VEKEGNMNNLEDLKTRIAAVPMDVIKIAVLKDEIELFESRIEPHDTGHLYTTIRTLEHRIEELENDLAILSRQDKGREKTKEKGY
jgi:hypothetical protein